MKRTRLRFGKQWPAVVMVAILLALLACAPTPITPPAIQIIMPADGSTLPTGDVTVSIQVSDFNLVDKLEPGTCFRI